MDSECTLIKVVNSTFDESGNEIATTEERTVMCQVFSVTRNEFYSAATVDLSPDLTIRLTDYADYEGEKLLRYNGELYSVIRTYRDRGSWHRSGGAMDINAIELVCARKIGNGN